MRPRKQLEEDRAAREKAERDLEVVRARWPKVHEQVAQLRQIRSRNHIREQFIAVFGRGQEGA